MTFTRSRKTRGWICESIFSNAPIAVLRFCVVAPKDKISTVGITIWFDEFDNIDWGKKCSLKNASIVWSSSFNQLKFGVWDDESTIDVNCIRYVAVWLSNVKAICNDKCSIRYVSCSLGTDRT